MNLRRNRLIAVCAAVFVIAFLGTWLCVHLATTGVTTYGGP